LRLFLGVVLEHTLDVGGNDVTWKNCEYKYSDLPREWEMTMLFMVFDNLGCTLTLDTIRQKRLGRRCDPGVVPWSFLII
jgi:hypothetical protein